MLLHAAGGGGDLDLLRTVFRPYKVQRNGNARRASWRRRDVGYVGEGDALAGGVSCCLDLTLASDHGIRVKFTRGIRVGAGERPGGPIQLGLFVDTDVVEIVHPNRLSCLIPFVDYEYDLELLLGSELGLLGAYIHHVCADGIVPAVACLL